MHADVVSHRMHSGATMPQEQELNMTIVNVTLSIDLRMDDNEDVDDVAESIASAASTMFPTLVMRVEHIDRDAPRTYGDLYRAEGYDPDADDDEDEETPGHLDGLASETGCGHVQGQEVGGCCD